MTRPIATMPKPQDWKYTIPDAHWAGRCARCGIAIWTVPFRDEVSAREYRISAMCQECQDVLFDEYPQSATHPDVHDYGPVEER